jgi:hypothetical protein
VRAGGRWRRTRAAGAESRSGANERNTKTERQRERAVQSVVVLARSHNATSTYPKSVCVRVSTPTRKLPPWRRPPTWCRARSRVPTPIRASTRSSSSPKRLVSRRTCFRALFDRRFGAKCRGTLPTLDISLRFILLYSPINIIIIKFQKTS